MSLKKAIELDNEKKFDQAIEMLEELSKFLIYTLLLVKRHYLTIEEIIHSKLVENSYVNQTIRNGV